MKFLIGVAGLMTLVFAHGAAGKEYLIGHQLHEHDMQIYANYLSGVDIAPAVPNMPMGADVIHLEADIHATGYGTHGIADGGWIPYLKVQYSLVKLGTSWKTAGELGPMIAKDGLHYGNNVRMNGPGDYQLVFQISPPSVNGLARHTDAGTGVPDWWKPFSADFEFSYPKE